MTPSRAPAYCLVRRTGTGPVGFPARPDPAQAAVVAHRDGPLLVVGAPGTGKTTTLVESFAARVARGVDPGAILVLTFGRRSATALRNQIEARVGAGAGGGGRAGGRATMSEAVVRTFPAYAFGLLRRAASEAGEPAPRLLTGPEQDAVIREMLADPEAGGRINWPDSLCHAVRTRAFAAELRDLLLRAAERGIGPARLAELGQAYRRADWVASARFYREYLQVLSLREASSRGSVAYDQAELVRVATELLADDAGLLAAEQARYRHVFVDELADTDPAQQDLLDRVAGGGASLIAFADPDSSTFAFRGSDPSAVTDFTERFRTAAGAPAPTITLGTNHRCGPALVAAASRVASRLRGPVRHRTVTAARAAGDATGARAGDGVTVAPGPGPGPAPGPAPASAPAPGPMLDVCALRSMASEAAYVAHRLREAHLHRGVPWSRMAVIVRSLHLRQAPLRRALAQAGVPTTVLAEDVALAAQPAVAPLIELIRCALDPSRLDEDTAVRLLHSPLGGADPFTERQLRQHLRAVAVAAGDRRPSGELLVEALRDPTELAPIDQRWARPARAVAGLIAAARKAAAGPAATAEDVLWAAWQASGLAERWAAASARGGPRGAAADQYLDAVLVLFDAAARFTDRLPGARIDAFLHHLLDQQLPADTLAATADRGEAVRVLTAHSAKGLEWDVVAVAGVQEGIWPDLRLRGSVLGSELLVDLAAGRPGSTVAQVSALLEEERRLFYVAVTRARQVLVVTAVDGAGAGGGHDEEQPSRFLAELAGREAVAPAEPVVPAESPAEPVVPAAEEGVPLVRLLPRPLTLPALVAELRTVVADSGSSPARRHAAAAQLARLATAGVPGADPEQWWGLRPLSDTRALVDPGRPVRVSPSTVELVRQCGLKWLLERHGGSDPPTAKQSLGNLVHAAAMLAEDAGTDPAALHEYVAQRFDAIEHAARWLAEREQARAERMVDKLLGWLTTNPRRLVAIEREFVRQLDPSADHEWPVELRGRVDRLEMDAEGRLVVIDLKTGSSPPTAAEVAEHPQLAAYQVAVEAGGFPEGDAAGGAQIVALGSDTASAVVREQPALTATADPGWAQAMVRRAAGSMAAATFQAVTNKSCARCAVVHCCPVSGKGRQVTE